MESGDRLADHWTETLRLEVRQVKARRLVGAAKSQLVKNPNYTH
jgi:hypothetical protein